MYLGQRIQAEAHSKATSAAVHVISKGKDNLKVIDF